MPYDEVAYQRIQKNKNLQRLETNKKIIKAKQLAKDIHKNQRHVDGSTHFSHLSSVVKHLQKLGIKDYEILCAGWLHDSIEDTRMDFQEIYKEFGPRVAKLVYWVSKDTRLPEKQREQDYIKQLEKSSWDAKVIKLADILHHFQEMQKIQNFDDKKIKRKINYINAIKYGLSQNKKKIPNLHVVENSINAFLKSQNRNGICF